MPLNPAVELGEQIAWRAKFLSQGVDRLDQLENCHGGSSAVAAYIADHDEHTALVLAFERSG
jgi:hypothetical protein